ncbi:hypothetical protein GCM10008955_11490 [Deinococcus malanensis]|uniref:DUF1330 domain-containing protein n=1 Tax=Deinococcus malanensis TaxID=1706855 RepID=A0ABQ2EPT2_9DEIO|nr:hypothetical protein [Deinococcus malanensis]GGK19747.1 hypothetical protein GCM10008955_11490 [Deinococcus malanensis]
MHIVQLLLPLYDNSGEAFEGELFTGVQQTLTERFGGLTAYVRAPAAGLWKEGDQTVRDDVVVYEVMTEELDRAWWFTYRESLRMRFRQDALVVRAQVVELL